MQKIFIETKYSCEKRRLDAAHFIKYFLSNGQEITNNPRNADIILIFTCGVTSLLSNLNYDEIKRYKKYKAELIVTGCLPEIEPDNLSKIFKGKIIPINKISKLDSYFPENKNLIGNIKDANIPYVTIDETKSLDILKLGILKTPILNKIFYKSLNHIVTNFFGDNYLDFGNILNIPIKDFYVLRISWGCNQNCSYCATKKAIGKHRSKEFLKCIEEFKQAISLGYKNIYIAADDIGAYGQDIGTNFIKLLDEITKYEGDYYIRIEGLNPTYLVKNINDFGRIIKRNKIKSINIPVQSGNERILKLMKRYSNIKNILDSIKIIKELDEQIRISTNIIIGFPSETENEFIDTMHFIIDADFDLGRILSISIRPDTYAYKLKQKISEETIKGRLKTFNKYLKKNGYNSILLNNSISFGRK
jgi:tRNA A37 methylthiotransferase MiaB